MISVSNTSGLRFDSRTLPAPVDRGWVQGWMGRRSGAAILESAARHPVWGRYSIYAADPVVEIRIPFEAASDPFQRLARVCRPWTAQANTVDLPFVGGWIGYLAYEAGRFAEPAAGWRATPLTVPIALWRLYDTAVVHDLFRDRWLAVGVELPRRGFAVRRPPLGLRLTEIERAFANSARGADWEGGLTHRWSSRQRWSDSAEEYRTKVRRILEYIRAGDVFQVNLSRRCCVDGVGRSPELYERLCETNPAGFAAYIRLEDQPADAAILSSSPELFLHVRDREVVTRPIKGTRPRRASDGQDRAARRELEASEKDRAELNMIIDLERNDLGRVCEYGSVRVENDGEIETHPTVFHRTATIAGRLRREVDVIDVLRATFPGGSITGAPKVRAMQIIHELEQIPRGAYCGAIGYIGLDGSMMLNLAIRTMVVSGGVADLHVGSGIVADSTPEEEHEELQAKAAGMLAALGPGSGHEHLAATAPVEDPSSQDTAAGRPVTSHGVTKGAMADVAS